MNIAEFNLLDDHQKVELIFDANKITERIDSEANYQFFQISNFYVESRTSLEGKFKRTIKTYTLKELPANYASEIVGMPIVTLNKQITSEPHLASEVKKKLFVTF